MPVARGPFRALARVAVLRTPAHIPAVAFALVSGRDRGRSRMKTKGKAMLRYAVAFLVIALVAGLIGFSGLAAGAVSVAKILFLIFLALFFVSLVLEWVRPGGR